jgi:hypothetical protein
VSKEEQPTNILPFAIPSNREPPVTAAELAEYRKLKPLLIQMLKEWQKIRTGCPIARRTIE